MLDIQTIRNDFPILSHKVYGKPLVYLDNAATTQKPRCVVEKIENGYYNVNANIHRGVHFLSQEATEAHEEARKTVQHFLNARSSNEIVFTRGTTESINLVASSFTDECMSAGDEVIISVMEHHSNIVPWQIQAAKKGISLRVIPMNEKGELLMDEYKKLFTDKTRLVAVTHVSNVLGTINPVKEIISIAHTHGVSAIDPSSESRCTGFGRRVLCFFRSQDLWAYRHWCPLWKRRMVRQTPPLPRRRRNDCNRYFRKDRIQRASLQVRGRNAGLYRKHGFSRSAELCGTYQLLRYATEKLSAIEGMRIFGQAADKGAVLSFLVGNIHHYDMGMLLDHLGIAVRTGHHCAQPLMQALGIEGTVRASFSFYNTKEEIDTLTAGIERVRKMF